ncbi:hypothetical protein F2Q70_00006470 [Brassica cretica]|uniref:Syntaxin N-terminal domain-containing protein n=1 Tax=Brassica cretica TaxID=69181 RepID=A0A8S9J4X6_BRACR|nr:hypothetical protein F2Q70_00006470 [Brassica cretica]
MNDLLKGSFELPRGQSSREGDVELGEQGNDQGLDDFFKKVHTFPTYSFYISPRRRRITSSSSIGTTYRTMNDLLKGSFELPRGQSSREGDVELGEQGSDQGLDDFFKKVQEIDKQYEKLNKLLKKLQAAHEESKAVTKAPAMKAIKKKMEKDVDEVGSIARFIKGKLEELDRENLANRQKAGCGKGSGVDRSRTATTLSLKKKFKDKMAEFQVLRENIQREYRDVVDRRIFTVTGQRADEDVSKADSSLVLNGLGSLNETLLLCRFLDDFFQTIDELIETGNSEQIFQKAIQEQGRGQVMDTLAEIQERHDAVRDLEKKLLDLQQVWLDFIYSLTR